MQLDRAGFEPRRGRVLAVVFLKMECCRFATNTYTFLPPRRTAQILRELTVWRGGSHQRAEIFALPTFLPFLCLFAANPDFGLSLGRVAFLDFPPLVASFPGFEAPVAQLDRVYDFGS